MSLFDDENIQIPNIGSSESALRGETAALLRQGRSILGEQTRLQSTLQPSLFQQAGFTPNIQDGQIVGFTPNNNNQLPQLQQQFFGSSNFDLSNEVERQLLERTNQALAGNVANPGLLRDIEQARLDLTEQLRRDLGPGFATSSPGIEAIGDFNERSLIARDQANRADIQVANQGALAQQQARVNELATLFGVNQAQAQQALNTANIFDTSGFSDLASGFSQAGNIFASDRALEAGIAGQNAANRAASDAALFQGAGTLGGLALQGAFSGGGGGGGFLSGLFGGGGNALPTQAATTAALGSGFAGSAGFFGGTAGGVGGATAAGATPFLSGAAFNAAPAAGIGGAAGFAPTAASGAATSGAAASGGLTAGSGAAGTGALAGIGTAAGVAAVLAFGPVMNSIFGGNQNLTPVELWQTGAGDFFSEKFEQGWTPEDVADFTLNTGGNVTAKVELLRAYTQIAPPQMREWFQDAFQVASAPGALGAAIDRANNIQGAGV